MKTCIPRRCVFVIVTLSCILLLSITFSATVVADREYSNNTNEPNNLLDYNNKNNKTFSETDNISHRRNQRTDHKVDTTKSKPLTVDSNRFIVVFKNSTSRSPKIINQTGAQVIGGKNIDITPVLFAIGSDSVQSKIKEFPSVKRVIKDESFTISPPPTNPSNTSNSTTSFDASNNDQSVPWGVSRIDGRSASESVSKQKQADVNIAVLDTGIDYTHPDIDDNVVWGANFVNGVERYGIETAADNNGHGTMVAGLIAAEDNDRGIVGVAPNAKIYSIKVLNKNNYGYYSWWIRGLDAAVKGPDNQLGTDDDADIVSMSIGGNSHSESLKNAIYSTSEHSMVVAAAMNSGDGNPKTNEVHYPAKYPETIAVAATKKNNQTATFSSEGEEVEVAAPGVGIKTLSNFGGTNRFSGTSASTPLVSGTLALMMAKNQSMSASEYRSILRETAIDIESPGVDKKAGHGLVQTDTAVQRVNPRNFDVKINSTNAPITPGETIEVMATVKNTGNELGTKNVKLHVPGVGSNSTRLTLSKSESQSVKLSVDSDEGDNGSRIVEISTPDDSATRNINITDHPVNLFNLTVDAPAEAVAGSEVTISVDAQAVDGQISAFQIASDEQPDHINDYDDLTVTTTAETQIEEPGFVVYNEVQDQVTVEWTGTIPDNAEAGDTFTLAGDALDEPQNRQLFSHTVTVTDDPLEKYRNENGEIDDTGLLEAISDWRDDDLEDTQLLQLISEWRDAGGNAEALPTGSLLRAN